MIKKLRMVGYSSVSLVIPAVVCDELNIDGGTSVRIEVKEGKIIITPVKVEVTDR